ncbi:hypothetical protein R3P38DRAFT_2767021 [Favolaschia claudopus]|uniref:Uncharacterized protein n=1 Tax=Favolaschia claudopus TaxID=2862362 RepID=A0AAW0CWB2_9AGAR
MYAREAGRVGWRWRFESARVVFGEQDIFFQLGFSRFWWEVGNSKMRPVLDRIYRVAQLLFPAGVSGGWSANLSGDVGGKPKDSLVTANKAKRREAHRHLARSKTEYCPVEKDAREGSGGQENICSRVSQGQDGGNAVERLEETREDKIRQKTFERKPRGKKKPQSSPLLPKAERKETRRLIDTSEGVKVLSSLRGSLALALYVLGEKHSREYCTDMYGSNVTRNAGSKMLPISSRVTHNRALVASL